VAADDAGLIMSMGPPDRPTRFILTHYAGDVFTFESIGENANGLAGAIFTVDAEGTASGVRLDYYDRTGLGTFTRDRPGTGPVAATDAGITSGTGAPAAGGRRSPAR
jgi:hypothetical protein